MASRTPTTMSVEEYVRTSFEGPDCDYLDGEVVERNIGERPHGKVQFIIGLLLFELQLKVDIVPEMRIQISPTRYRVADLAVWRTAHPGERIPKTPPFLVVEIVSPEDRKSRMESRIQDYLSIGVEWVWLVDPQKSKAVCYSQQNRAGSACAVLRTENPPITLALDDVLKRANL